MDLFKNGIWYIVASIVVGVVDFIIKAATKGLEDTTSLLYKRLKKYSTASAIMIFLYWIVISISNRELQIQLSHEEKMQYLIIFLGSIGVFYVNAIISTFVMEMVIKNSSIVNLEKKETIRSIFMALIVTLLLLIITLWLGNVMSIGKNVIANDVIVEYDKSDYKLIKGTYFDFEYKSNSNRKQNNGYSYVTKGNEYKVVKGTKINIFRGTELKLEATTDRTVDFYNNNQIAKADIFTTDKSSIQLEKDALIELKCDALVNLNQTNETVNSFFFQCQVVEFMLILYYVFDVFDVFDAFKRR